MPVPEQKMLRGPGPLLDTHGHLADVGWARQPLLDCNLENAHFYDRFRFWQRFRLKCWDYYAVTTPTHFFSFTIGDVGYLGQVFAYVIDFETGRFHEQTINLPLARGITLPRNAHKGVSSYASRAAWMRFTTEPNSRSLFVRWPGFDAKKGLSAEITLALPPEHQSMAIVIPIGERRFYYNRKVNCMPAEGWVEYAGTRYALTHKNALGNLDWGRGVWEYRSFWIWASASGFLADGRRVGLNLGTGFGDTSAATENALILDGCIHKLGEVRFTYKLPNLFAIRGAWKRRTARWR